MSVNIYLQGTVVVQGAAAIFDKTPRDQFVILKISQTDRHGAVNIVDLFLPASALDWAKNVAAALNAPMVQPETLGEVLALATVQPGAE